MWPCSGNRPLASYHLSAQIIKRSQGRSAVAAAAYRAAARMTDGQGTVHDYSARRGVAHAEVMAPDHAPAWMRDRERLWRAIEDGEKRRDAQLAREINMALPHELTDAQRLELVRGFVAEQFVARGMVADVAIHQPVREKGDDPRNHHAHVMLSLRQANRDGFHRTKTREWNSDDALKEWRAAWANWQNAALGRGGHLAQVDHRSLATQRAEAARAGDRVRAAQLDREPEIHIGPRAMKVVERGVRPDSRDRAAGPVRARDRLRPGEFERSVTRVYVDEGEGERNWLKRQFADRKTVERREYRDRAKRIVRYTVIDHGTRFEANMRRIERNCERMEKNLARLQQKAARLRDRRHWLTQQELEWQQYLRRLHWEREQAERRRLWKKKQDEAAVYRAMFRVDHVKKRSRLADGLIRQIDAVLAGLLGIRERQLGRLRSGRGRAAARPRPAGGRPGRARSRNGPSRPGP